MVLYPPGSPGTRVCIPACSGHPGVFLPGTVARGNDAGKMGNSGTASTTTTITANTQPLMISDSARGLGVGPTSLSLSRGCPRLGHVHVPGRVPGTRVPTTQITTHRTRPG
eukprot:3044667-Rhodomonas_salina.3